MVAMRGKGEKGIGKGREGREARERARLGYLSAAAELLVTYLCMLSVDILSVIRNGAAAAMRTLATSTAPIGSIDSPLSSFITPSLFHSMLKRC